MSETEEELLDALKALVEWYEMPEVLTSVGVQRFANAKRLIKEIDGRDKNAREAG